MIVLTSSLIGNPQGQVTSLHTVTPAYLKKSRSVKPLIKLALFGTRAPLLHYQIFKFLPALPPRLVVRGEVCGVLRGDIAEAQQGVRGYCLG